MLKRTAKQAHRHKGLITQAYRPVLKKHIGIMRCPGNRRIRHGVGFCEDTGDEESQPLLRSMCGTNEQTLPLSPGSGDPA